jgi:hypothetical protein
MLNCLGYALHDAKFFFKGGGNCTLLSRVSLGWAATLFGKAWVWELEGAAFTMCVDAWVGLFVVYLTIPYLSKDSLTHRSDR